MIEFKDLLNRKFYLKSDIESDLKFVPKSGFKSDLAPNLMTINSALKPKVTTSEIGNFLTFNSAEGTW